MHWYYGRMNDGSDNNWGWFALLMVLVISYFKWAQKEKERRVKFNYLVINFLVFCYFMAMLFSVPMLLQSVILALIVAIALCYFNGLKRLNLGIVGLMILSLPLFASLDFYCGYPLRLLIGRIGLWFISLQGLNVSLEGVNFVFANKVILIDGPCSGIKMMWMASFLVFSFVAHFEFSARQSLKLSVMACITVLIANVLRVSALFYLESGLLAELKWMHELVGLVCYGVAIATILFFVLHLDRMPITNHVEIK